MENKGFRKGKLPDRFKGWTAQTIEMTPSSYIAHICDTAIKEENKLIEDKIVCHLNAYYDDELMAAQYVTKMQKLEKALDKACGKIALLFDDYERIESTWSVDEWKEWCMNDD